EPHRQGVMAIVAGIGFEAGEALHAVDLLLDGDGNRVRQYLGVGPRVKRGDLDDPAGPGSVGLAPRQRRNGEHSQEDWREASHDYLQDAGPDKDMISSDSLPGTPCIRLSRRPLANEWLASFVRRSAHPMK